MLKLPVLIPQYCALAAAATAANNTYRSPSVCFFFSFFFHQNQSEEETLNKTWGENGKERRRRRRRRRKNERTTLRCSKTIGVVRLIYTWCWCSRRSYLLILLILFFSSPVHFSCEIQPRRVVFEYAESIFKCLVRMCDHSGSHTHTHTCSLYIGNTLGERRCRRATHSHRIHRRVIWIDVRMIVFLCDVTALHQA